MHATGRLTVADSTVLVAHQTYPGVQLWPAMSGVTACISFGLFREDVKALAALQQALAAGPDKLCWCPQYYGVFQLAHSTRSSSPAALDTGSSDTWVPSTSCVNPSCLTHDRYSTAASSTFNVSCLLLIATHVSNSGSADRLA